MTHRPIIAIHVDTLVLTHGPDIMAVDAVAIDALQQLQAHGYGLYLYTTMQDARCNEFLHLLRDAGFNPDATGFRLNNEGRPTDCDLYLDDRNAPYGFPGWDSVLPVLLANDID